MKYNSQWPGTEGASLGGAAGAASGARPSRYHNEGWQILTAIMNGKELPNWIGGDLHQRFDRVWDSDDHTLCDAIIKNTQKELERSRAEHEAWREQERVKNAGRPFNERSHGHHDQGWLDRKSIWNRPCWAGAVASLVIKIKGMQLKKDLRTNKVDRRGATDAVKVALVRAGMDGLDKAILDVVCSNTDKDEATSGPPCAVGTERITCTFYVRFPAYLGEVAKNVWTPRLWTMKIAQCQVEPSLLFGEGKERLYGGTQQRIGWDVTVGGVAPTTGVDAATMRRSCTYIPETQESQYLKDLAKRYSAESQHLKEIGDFSWTRQLMIVDGNIPVDPADWPEMKRGQTWNHWQHLSSNNYKSIWGALTSLFNAGHGDVIDNKWVPRNSLHYKLYKPDRRHVPNGQPWKTHDYHMDLNFGELALTMDQPRELTYWYNGKEYKIRGVLAMAVTPYPRFSVRTCSTYHQVEPENMAQPMEYRQLEEAINQALSKGIQGLCNYLAQEQQQMGPSGACGSQEPWRVTWQGTPQPLAWDQQQPQLIQVTPEPVQRAVEIQEVTPSLMDLPNPDVIIAEPGEGPLRCLQVDQRVQERKEKRMNGISEWIEDAMEEYQMCNNNLTEKVEELTRTFSLDIWKVKKEKSRRKHEVLTAMLRETSQAEGKCYAENPEQEWILEFRTAWSTSGGPELDKRLSDEYRKKAERSQRAMESEDTWRMARIPEEDAEHDPWAVVPIGSPTEIMPLTTTSSE